VRAREVAPAPLDPTTVLLQLAFYALFVVSAWRYFQRRGPLELSVVAVFGTFVALFLLSFVNGLAPVLTPIVRPGLIAILFAQPYMVLRLIGQIQPVSARASRAVLLGGVAAIAALVAAPGSPSALIPAVGYFFIAQTGCAIRFAVESQRRFGLARVRLALASVATVMFAGAILIAGVASASSGGSASTGAQAVTRLAALLAGFGYLAAFVPPGWLRRFAYRALAFDLVRNLVAPPAGTDAGRLWEQLAGTAREILGARTVSILTESGGLQLAIVGDPISRELRVHAELSDDDSVPVEAVAPATENLPAVADGPGVESGPSMERKVSRIEVAVRGPAGSGAPHQEVLVAQIEGRPLFVEDDVALLQLLGSLTARAVDREEVLIGLGEARRALEESAAIRASEARFRALLEADPNAILALDENERVTWATRQAGELFGCPAEDLVGVPLSDLVVLHHDTAVAAPSSERPVIRAETTGRRADGNRFPAEIARTEYLLDGRPFQLAVISDVTWRHEADQIRERFLGVLSHELRTPVTSIYGGTQLLLGRGSRLDAATRTELLTNVAAESERLQRMIENLVAMARMERGADFGGPRPVLVERIIKQLVERERGLWPDVTIKFAAHGPIRMVAADEEYLAQIMRNLLSNAAKYSGPGSTVEVVVAEGDDDVVILVRDDGPGINEEDADKLFNLYFRAAQQASSAPGAGIGLFVCRELVATMGGRIWAKPRPEGGAEFGFSLPAYPDELEPVVDDHVHLARDAQASQDAPAPQAATA
jgi:PAS domain S-box-containing protein